MCGSGSHFPAAAVAAVAMVVYVLLFPLMLFNWLWRDPWLKEQLIQIRSSRAMAEKAAEAGSPGIRVGKIKKPAKNSALGRTSSRVAPMAAGLGSDPGLRRSEPSGNSDSVREPQTSDAVTDNAIVKGHAFDPVFAACFAGAGYDTHAWYFRLLDLFAVLGLAAVQATIPRPLVIQKLVIKVR